MKRILLAFFLLFVMGAASAQVTVFADDFSTNQSTTYTTSGAIGASAWSVTTGGVAGQDFGARRNTSPAQLELTNDATAAANQNGWGFAYTPTASFTAPYNPTLSSNSGVVTWTFNMRQIRADPAGFNTTSSYGAAFVLGSTSSASNTTGNGYAVILGNTTATDPVRLVKFTGGLTSLGTSAPPTANDIVYSNTAGLTDFGSEYLSVKVTYTPSTNTWELFLRNDGGAFVDPMTGSLTSQGTAVDATYTGVSLDYLGAYWQGSTAANQTAFFDNVLVTITYANTITTGTVSTPPFVLTDCLDTETGTVTFTTTDVFGFANTFTAQLSDDVGSFAAPVNIGAITIGGPGPTWPPIPITIQAGTVSGTGYRIRVVSDMPVVIGSSSVPFTVTQAGYCASSHTDYYRTITSGDWDDPATWESSPDGLVWISPATLAPTFNAKTILIRNTHTVTLATAASADELTIQSGGMLIHSNGVGFTLNDGTGTDMIIQSGGTYVLNGSQPAGTGTVNVQSGALIRVDGNSAPSESDDFAYGGVVSVTFNTGSVYEWNTNTFTPSWTGRTYFTNGQNTTFRFSQSPNFNLGGNSPTTIYGTLEANAPIAIVGGIVGVPSDKAFTHGILGTGNINASALIGDLIITAAAASLGGSGTLTTSSSAGYYLRISASTVTMTSSKAITGDVQFIGTSYIVLGNFDLTVSGVFSGIGTTAYIKTNGTGILKETSIGATIRIFPIGNSSYNPIYITNGNLADYSARVDDGIKDPTVAFPTYGIQKTWYIGASVATPGVTVAYQYYTADFGAGILPTDQVEILQSDYTTWSISPGNTGITQVGGPPYSVTTTTALTINNSLVPYAIGKNGGWILPIDCIISTRAQKVNTTGLIKWTVNSCSEVRSFEVQRSVNNSGFQTIGIVSPVVNQTDFSFTDPALSGGTNLYRIKVNGITGASKYSNTAAIIQNSNDILITSLAPNPVHNSAMLTISTGRPSVVSFKVYNISGSLVKQWQSNIADGNNTIEMNVSELPAGMYTLFVSNSDANTVSRFVKQ